MNATDNSMNVTIGASIQGLLKGLGEAQAAVKTSTEHMKSSLDTAVAGVGKLTAAFAALTAIAVGGRLFGSAIEQSRSMTTEAASLGKIMGITTTEASVMVEAFDDVGGTVEGAKAGLTGLMRTLKSSPEKFAELGVSVKDSTGHMRSMLDIQLDVNARFGEMAEGTEKNLAMAQIFGRSWQSVGKVMNLTRDDIETTRVSVEELGLLVGQESVESAKKYRNAMHDLDDVMNGMQKAIGDAVMPMLTQLAEWLREIGPVAVTVMKGAIGGLVAVFWGLKNGITIAVAAINGVVFTLAEPILALIEAIQLAIDGKWGEAAARLKAVGGNIVNNWKAVGDDMLKSSADTQEKIWNLFAKPTATTMKGGKAAPTIGGAAEGNTTTKPPAEKSRMGEWESSLKEAEIAFQRANDLRELSKEQIRDYWQGVKAINENGLTDGEALSLRRKIAQTELDVLKKQAADRKAFSAEAIDANESASKAQLDIAEAASQQLLAMGGATAAESLAFDVQLAKDRLAIEQAAQRSRMELAKSEFGASSIEAQRAADKLVEINAKYGLQIAKANGKLAVELNRPYEEMKSAMTGAYQSGLDSLFDRTKTFGAKMKALWVQIATVFVQEAVTKPVAAHLAGETAKTAATVAGGAQRTAADWFAAGQSVLATAWAAIKNIAIKAWEVAAAVYAAIAAIPYVGPFLAPVMAIAATGAVLGFASHIASAEGGFDIPAGMNPITQLHEQEMVLPKEQANAVRDMASGGGGGNQIHVHIKAMDSKDVRRALMDNKSGLASAIKAAVRYGHAA